MKSFQGNQRKAWIRVHGYTCWTSHRDYLCTILSQKWQNTDFGEHNNTTIYNRRSLSKHRRFWATDGNRKLNFSLFGALSRHRVCNVKPQLSSRDFPVRGKEQNHAKKKETFDFQLPSVAHERLCWSSLMIFQVERKRKNNERKKYNENLYTRTSLTCYTTCSLAPFNQA